MVSLFLEVINPNSGNTDFYNPAPEGFSAYPRTESGVKKAISKMKKMILSDGRFPDFRIACYDGKKEYWNDKPFIGYIDSKTILENF